MKKLLFVLLALLMPMVSDAKKAQVRYATFNIRYINGDDEAKGYGWSVRRDRVAEMILDKVTIADKCIVSKEQFMETIKGRDIDCLVTFGAGDIDRFINPIEEYIKTIC